MGRHYLHAERRRVVLAVVVRVLGAAVRHAQLEAGAGKQLPQEWLRAGQGRPLQLDQDLDVLAVWEVAQDWAGSKVSGAPHQSGRRVTLHAHL